MSDSTPPISATPTSPQRVFVAYRTRLRGMISLLFFGIVLVQTTQSPLLADMRVAKYVVLGVLGFLICICILMILWPARFIVGSDFQFEIGGPLIRFHSPLTNIRGITFDGRLLRLVFHEIALVEPKPIGSEKLDVEMMLKQAEKRYLRDGAHFTASGFTLAQVEELREEVGLPPPTMDEPAGRVEEFHRALGIRTPRIWVTGLLIAINITVFAVMVFSGVHPIEPTTENLIEWGADFAPLTTSGEWWRLLTATFLHVGVFHILMNMWALAVIGSLVERLLGNVGFLVLYLVAGLCGSVSSLSWNPLMVSAGASGAVFGLFGALLGFLVVSKQEIPKESLRNLRRSGVAFVGYNLLFGFLVPGIDQAAHIGGLVAGFMSGLILAGPLTPQPVTRRVVRTILVAGIGLLVVSIAMLAFPRGFVGNDAYVRALTDFEGVEKRSLDRFNEVITVFEQNGMTEVELAERIETEILPPWRDIRQRVLDIQEVPNQFQEQRPVLIAYLTARQEGWEMLARSIRTNDPALGAKAMEEFKKAEQLIHRLHALRT